MQDTSFFVAPIRDHAFFEQTVLERQIGDALLQGAGFTAQILDLIGRGGARGVTGQAALARLHELLRPSVIQALGDTLLAAQLGDAVVPAQTVEHNPDLVLRREMTTRRTPDVLHHLLSSLFGAGGFGAHLRSFVTTTRPKSSLNHNLKSVPLALTANKRTLSLMARASFSKAFCSRTSARRNMRPTARSNRATPSSVNRVIVSRTVATSVASRRKGDSAR